MAKERWRRWVQQWFPLDFDHVFIAYLPNKNKDKRTFNVRPWETKALKLYGRLFGGATSYPSRGSYRKIDESGRIKSKPMLESTRMVTSFVMDEDLTEKALTEVAGFLKEFGRATGQETVAFVLDGEMHWIPIEY